MNIFITDFLTIEVIQQCNLNCDMCLRGESTGKRITREVVEKIFDEVKYVRCIVFTGGEVTLAYNEIKMIIDVIKEKNVTIDEYQIVVNGTIYNKKLFDLLKNSFKKGTIAISCDYYHDKSIKENYKDKIETVMKNYKKITEEEQFIGLYHLPYILFNSGRAKNLTDVIKEEPSIIGFASMIKNNKYLYVGPEICIDVNGNLVSGNNTYEITNDNHFGNIFDTSLSELIRKNSVRNYFLSKTHFIIVKNILENNYFFGKLNRRGYSIKNKKLVKNVKRKIIYPENINQEVNDDSKRLIYKYKNNEYIDI